jgi:hypothetical protein
MAQLNYKPPARLGCCPEGMCIDEAKIIAAERERCAKIAEDYDRVGFATSTFQGVEIAALIRSAKT